MAGALGSAKGDGVSAEAEVEPRVLINGEGVKDESFDADADAALAGEDDNAVGKKM